MYEEDTDEDIAKMLISMADGVSWLINDDLLYEAAKRLKSMASARWLERHL